MSDSENNRDFLISTITRVVRQATGLHEHFSCEIANAVVDELGRQHGCEKIYIPAVPKSVKREAVLSDFDGRNGDRVCRQHGISKATLYRYVNERVS